MADENEHNIGGYNPQEIVPKVIAGDSTATGLLDSHLRTRYEPFFWQRLASQAEDLTQETVIAIILGITQFDPSKGKGDFNTNFQSWCNAIARYTLVHAYRSQSRRPQTKPLSGFEAVVPTNPQPSEQELQDLMPHFRDKLSDILTPGQLEVTLLRLDGKTPDQVKRDLGITDNLYTDRMTGARSRYEQQLLFPAGFRTLPSPAFVEAARRGTLEAARLIDRYYSTDQWIQGYLPRKRKLSYIGAPEGESVRLSDIESPLSYQERLRLVQTGKIPAQKSGRYWFTSQEAYDTYINGLQPETKGVIAGDSTPLGLLIMPSNSKYNIRQLAGRLGVSEETVRRWAIGTRIPNEESIHKLLDLLDVDDKERETILEQWSKSPPRRKRGH